MQSNSINTRSDAPRTPEVPVGPNMPFDTTDTTMSSGTEEHTDVEQHLPASREEVIQWGLVAGAGTSYADSDGFSTWVDVKGGGEIWIFCQENTGSVWVQTFKP